MGKGLQPCAACVPQLLPFSLALLVSGVKCHGICKKELLLKNHFALKIAEVQEADVVG